MYGGRPHGVGQGVGEAGVGLAGGHRDCDAAVGHHHAGAGVARTSLQVKR